VTSSDPWLLGLLAVVSNRLGDYDAALKNIAALKALPNGKSTKEAVDAIRGFYSFTDDTFNKKLAGIIDEFHSLYDLQG
jgi:hypothetical protein